MIGPIVNSASGLVLDDPSSSTTTGPIQQSQLNGGGNQMWEFIPLSFVSTGGGDSGFSYTGVYYYEIKNWASGLVLDSSNGSVGLGTPIQQDPWRGALSQEWTIPGTFTAHPWHATAVTGAGGKVSDGPGGPTANGTTIQLAQGNGAVGQPPTIPVNPPLSPVWTIGINPTALDAILAESDSAGRLSTRRRTSAVPWPPGRTSTATSI